MSLYDADLASLMAEARAVRDGAHGTRVTYSPKVFIPLTMLCRDRCGYCTFAQPPARLESPYLTPEQVQRHRPRRGPGRLPRGAVHPRRGARGALPGRRELARRPRLRPARSTTSPPWPSWCSTRPGMLPHANAGALDHADLARLRTVSPSQGMMIESLRADLPCHRGAPDKTPSVGWPRSRPPASSPSPSPPGSSSASARTVTTASSALRGDRRVAPAPRPRPGGDRPELPAQGRHRHARSSRPVPPDDYLEAIALARLILPPEVHLQAPPEPLRRLRRAARRRHRRLGRRLPRHRRPRQPRAALARPRPSPRRPPRPAG